MCICKYLNIVGGRRLKCDQQHKRANEMKSHVIASMFTASVIARQSHDLMHIVYLKAKNQGRIKRVRNFLLWPTFAAVKINGCSQQCILSDK
jgi:hypothetical protein